MVGQSLYSLMPWRISGSCRTSTVSYLVPSRSRIAIARLEKPHCGKSAVPFMKRTTSFEPTMSAIRAFGSLTDCLLRHRGLELQCVKLSPYSPPKRGIDRLMLPDPAHPFKAAADNTCGIMVAVSGKIANDHFGVRNGCLDQPFDLGCSHRHQIFVASMIWRRASISLLRIASMTIDSSQSSPAAVRSPSTLRITSCSPASSKSERTTSLA